MNCKWCNSERTHGADECLGCWHLRKKIEGKPDIAEAILAAYRDKQAFEAMGGGEWRDKAVTEELTPWNQEEEEGLFWD